MDQGSTDDTVKSTVCIISSSGANCAPSCIFLFKGSSYAALSTLCANFNSDEHRHFHFVRRARWVSVCVRRHNFDEHITNIDPQYTLDARLEIKQKIYSRCTCICICTHIYTRAHPAQGSARPCTYLMLYKCAVERAARLDGKCCWWNKIPVCVHIYVARARHHHQHSAEWVRDIYRERGRGIFFMEILNYYVAERQPLLALCMHGWKFIDYTYAREP